MPDAISKLRSLTGEIKAREEELRAYFTHLADRLTEAAGGHEVRGVSENRTLETYGDDDAYYGYLFFNEGRRLGVAYRTREEDVERAFSDEQGEPAYHVEELDKCSPVWLRALSEPKVIESLLANINARVEEELSATKSGVQVLSATTNLPLRDLDRGLVEAAKKLDFGVVIEHWQSAQSALSVDPPDATTRASSLIETLSRHILAATGTPLPRMRASNICTVQPREQSASAPNNK